MSSMAWGWRRRVGGGVDISRDYFGRRSEKQKTYRKPQKIKDLSISFRVGPRWVCPAAHAASGFSGAWIDFNN
jgi:hypothetical protein